MVDRWSTNSWTQESVAVERQSDGSYKLAVKNTNIRNKGKSNEETTIDWQVFSISSSGVLDPISTFGGIVKQEDSFNQDLNGDGGKGLSASLSTVNSDITGEKLKRDSENSLYIDLNNGASPTPILDQQGGVPIFDQTHSWTDSGGSGSWKQEAIAIEQQDDGTFKLAVKNTDTYNSVANVNWNVYSVSSAGVLDWNNSTWGGIAKYESFFNRI